MSTVTWVQNGSSEWEISSVDHLLSLLSMGTGYTNTNAPPTLTTGSYHTTYRQTVDLDMTGQTIPQVYDRVFGLYFQGIYKGTGYEIQNVSVVSSASSSRCGLFSYLGGDAYLEDVTVTGLCSVTVSHDNVLYAGLLCGHAECDPLKNVKMNCDAGSSMTVTGTGNQSYFGGMVGSARIQSASMEGYFDINITAPNPTNYIGSVGLLGGAVSDGEVSSRQMYTVECSAKGTINSTTLLSNVGGMIGYLSTAQDTTYAPTKNMKAISFCGEVDVTANAYRIGGMFGNIVSNTKATCFFQGSKGNLHSTKAGASMSPFAAGINSMAWHMTTLIGSVEGNVTGDSTVNARLIAGSSSGCTGVRGWYYFKGDISTTNGSPLVGAESARATLFTNELTVNGVTPDDYYTSSTDTQVTSDLSAALVQLGTTPASIFDIFDRDIRWNESLYTYTPIVAPNGETFRPVYRGGSLVEGMDYTIVSEGPTTFPIAVSQTDTSSKGFRYSVSGTTVAMTSGYSTATVTEPGYTLEKYRMTLAWTQDGDSAYEITTMNHLLAALGDTDDFTTSLDANDGRSGIVFKLTNDIDNRNRVVPTSSDYAHPFVGTLDGNGFTVSNFGIATSEGQTKAGLAHECGSGAILTNFKISGTVTCTSSHSTVTEIGFLAAKATGASFTGIEIDLSTGSSVTVSDASSDAKIGIVAGDTSTSIVSGVSVSGFCETDIAAALGTGSCYGGCIGSASPGDGDLGHVSYGCTGNVQGAGHVESVGGVFGALRCDGALSGFVRNLSIGDVTVPSDFAGGAVGSFAMGVGGTGQVINSMNGTLSSSSTGSTGGLFGVWEDVVGSSAGGVLLDVMVSSRGNIVGGPLKASPFAGTYSCLYADQALLRGYCAISGDVVDEGASGTQATLLPEGVVRLSGVHVVTDTGMTFNGASPVATVNEIVVDDAVATKTALDGTGPFVSHANWTLPYYVPLDEEGAKVPVFFPGCNTMSGFEGSQVVVLTESGFSYGPASVTNSETSPSNGFLYVLSKNQLTSPDGHTTVTSFVHPYVGSVESINDTFVPPEIISWVNDGTTYDISSPFHLIDFLSGGNDFRAISTGAPSEYNTAKYRLTNDIDCLVVCGENGEKLPFYFSSAALGLYDWRGELYGNGYTLNNVRVGTNNGGYKYAGLIPYSLFLANAFEDVRLGGVCKLVVDDPVTQYAGLLCGYRYSYSSTYTSNISAHFESGSSIDVTDCASGADVGGLFGFVSNVRYVEVSGYLDATINSSTTLRSFGGVFGESGNNPNGASTAGIALRVEGDVVASTPVTYLGGMGGYWACTDGNLKHSILNQRIGKVQTTDASTGTYTGGIAGYFLPNVYTKLVHSQVGDVLGNGGYVGGVAGHFDMTKSSMNYGGCLVVNTSGDITNTSINTGLVGGKLTFQTFSDRFVGYFAMNGSLTAPGRSVDEAIHYNDVAFRRIQWCVDTGLLVNGSSLSTDTSDPNGYKKKIPIDDLKSEAYYISKLQYMAFDVRWIFKTDFPYPYMLSNYRGGVDGEITPLLFGAASSVTGLGSATYAIISAGDVEGPGNLKITHSDADDNLEGYLHYVDDVGKIVMTTVPENVSVEAPYTVTAIPISFGTTPSASTILVQWALIEGMNLYKISIKESGGKEIHLLPTVNLTKIVKNLVPETTYVVTLYSSADAGESWTKVADTSSTTSVAAAVTKADFLEDGVIRLDDVYDVSTVKSNMESLFSTGDRLSLRTTVANSSKKLSAFFVEKGATVNLKDRGDDDAFIAPFDSTAGSGQSFDMVLSDSSTTTVSFDEVENTVTIGGEVLSVGDSIIIDGTLMTVSEY